MDLKAHVLSQTSLPLERLEIPEWGCTVYVRTVTAAERDHFEAESLVKRGKTRETNLENLRARMAALALADETGARLFADGDAALLAGLSAKALDRVYSVATRLNGWSEADVEELTKN